MENQTYSEGQSNALEQLFQLNDDDNDPLSIISEPELVNNYLKVQVSLSTGSNEESNSRLRFRTREKVEIEIPEDFPVEIPSVKFLSNRYWHYPYVQWGNYICFYKALNIKWRSTDTILGFIKNLDCWFKLLTTGKINQVDVLLSPPNILKIEPSQKILVRKNRSILKDESKYWTGFALIHGQNEHHYEIEDWKDYSEDFRSDKILALSIFFNFCLHYKYPKTVLDLLNLFSENGIELDHFVTLLSKQLLQIGNSKKFI